MFFNIGTHPFYITMSLNRAMVFAGIATLFQAVGQMIFTALAISQYFCVVDFLRELPLLLYIRILYFHNPSGCGIRINIGQFIDGIADQAFVLLTQEPLTAFRTFIINSTGLGLSVLWIITSAILIMGGAKDKQSRHVRWPWIIITICICVLDLVATVTYCNDTFYTRTLSDMMDFIGGLASGTAGANLDTTWTSWLMVIIYSRFVVFFLLNLFLIVLMIVDCNVTKETENIDILIEAPTENVSDTEAKLPPPPPLMPPTTESDAQIEAGPVESPVIAAVTNTATTQTTIGSTSEKDIEETSIPSNKSITRIPRAGISRSFQRMKSLLFKRSTSLDGPSRSNADSLNISPNRSPQAHRVDAEKKRGVNFPENLLSLPQRLENMISEQQKRLDREIIDTAGKRSPPRVSQSMPQLNTSSNQPDTTQGRRGTTVELQGQLPWAYIPASAHRMRDQLPPDEDLPPVPLPDYTAIQSFRKASVHRAASSLSSLTQKKDYALSQSSRPALTQSDVLY